MSLKRNFRPLAFAGVLMIAAPQAQAQLFWFLPQEPAPAAKQLKPGEKAAKPAKPAPQKLTRASDADPAARNSLYQIDRPVYGHHDSVYGYGQREAEPLARGAGAGTAVAALPADADPNYSTPVDLDGSVNFKQQTQRIVADPTHEPAGTLTINTGKRKLYYSLGDGQAVEYGIAVGKAGFAWKGEAMIGRKAYWPGWTPPPEMIERRPELPDHMDGSLSNPLGARALYLFQGNKDTLFRIHGTNEPSSIGHAASSGCIRMHNADVIDLYGRVSKGARVVVM
jgi:lipoprotein-anchoring transpeptidase ErfK/SrfK